MLEDSGRDLTEETLSSEVVFDGRLLHVRLDRVRLPDGGECSREWVHHPGAVVILAELDDGRLLFERQHRYPVRRDFIELPAGKIDPGEDILDTARRELLEETGYVACEWTYLGVMHPCIGYSDERIEIFRATGLEHRGAELDDGEHVEVFALDIDSALDMAWDGRITDAKTLSALLWAVRARLNR